MMLSIFHALILLLCVVPSYSTQNISGTSNTVILLHLHKGGGTTICSIAKNNRITTPTPGKTKQDGASFLSKNCNPSVAAKPNAWTDNGEKGVTQFLRESRVGFYAIEAPIRARYAFPALRDFPPNVTLVSLIREPHSLMLSLCGVPDLEPKSKSSECYEREKNVQIRTYVGCQAQSDFTTCATKKYPPLTAANAESSVATAVEYISHTVALITHRFGDASYILRHQLNWTYTNTTLYRAGTHKQYPALTSAQVAYIDAAITYDKVFYAAAMKQMDAHLRDALEFSKEDIAISPWPLVVHGQLPTKSAAPVRSKHKPTPKHSVITPVRSKHKPTPKNSVITT